MGRPEGIFEVTEATLRLTVNNISDLYTPIYSPETVLVRRLPWRLFAKPVEDKVNRTTTLGFFLQCDWKQDSPDWSCKTEMVMRIIAQKKKCSDFAMDMTTHAFNSVQDDWGYTEFLPWTKLVDPQNGYVLRNSIILEVALKADQPTGIKFDQSEDAPSPTNSLSGNLMAAAAALARELPGGSEETDSNGNISIQLLENATLELQKVKAGNEKLKNELADLQKSFDAVPVPSSNFVDVISQEPLEAMVNLLLQILCSPNGPQQQGKLVEILMTNPGLMAELTRRQRKQTDFVKNDGKTKRVGAELEHNNLNIP